MLRSLFALVLLVAVLPARLLSQDPPPLRILPLGDSITLGKSLPVTYSGYRDLLQALLADANYNVDFVGTQTDTQNASITDPHHEGHSGFRIDQIDSGLDSWLRRIDDPDIVLLMIGTNDFLQSHQTAQASNRLASLIARIAIARPFANIVVGSLVPNTANASIEAAQVNYNAAIPGVVSNQVALGRKVTFVDLHAAVTAADISSDGIHPTQTGYDKLANEWFDAVTPIAGPYGDNKAPAVARIDSVDRQHVAVTFSKPLEDAAASPTRFALNNGIAVTAAVLDAATKRTITLTTSSQPQAESHTVTVTGVRDRTPAHHSVVAGTTASFTTPTLANGSFEFNTTAWNASGNQQIVADLEKYLRDGRRTIVFNGGQSTPNGVLSQAFETVPGQAYQLALDVGVVAFNSSEQRLQVALQGANPLLTQNVSVFGNGNGTVIWSNRTFSFVADSTSTTLTLRDQSPTTNNVDLLLDHVRVTPISVQSLTVQSNPDAGVNITVSPADRNGAGGGATPYSRLYNQGTVVTLTAPASANGKTFQKWQRNGADYDTQASTQVTMNADHTLRAVYVAGAPLITAEPADLTATNGHTATFNVTAEGSGTLTYQWRFDGQNITGATQSTLTLNNVQAANAGLYDVVVTNPNGSLTSNAAELTVIASGILANRSFESEFQSWIRSGNVTTFAGTRPAATQGERLVIFNGGQSTPNGVLVQRFTTVPGQNYNLAFDAGVYAVNTSQQRLRVEAIGAATLLSQTVTITGTGNGSGVTRWVPTATSFVADSTVTTLRFIDVSTTSQNLDLLLDNITLSVGSLTRTLSVNASPAGPVSITVSPTDTEGDGNGVTPFTRTFNNGTVVSVTAPATASGNAFQKWVLNGADYSTQQSTNITLSGNQSLTAVYSTPQILANGSFEADFASWTATGNQITYAGAPYTPTDGAKLVIMNGANTEPNAVLTQTFATTPGQMYAVHFDMGVRAFNRNSVRLQVTVTGSSTLVSQTPSLAGLGGGTLRWLARSFLFTADSTTTTLRLEDVSTSTDSLDLLVDHVRILAQ